MLLHSVGTAYQPDAHFSLLNRMKLSSQVCRLSLQFISVQLAVACTHLIQSKCKVVK